ncbi:hypothetical protein [Eubacterium sp.]|uniref:hypothetical protein n=1 Tax=Eubacterium sp. TaxID=142586 RepID=UPI0026DFA975|nr:hypothetical protein [Eubacterium sp.]MDO5432594.1 hypothetical protein [Eubacterium sp.]
MEFEVIFTVDDGINPNEVTSTMSKDLITTGDPYTIVAYTYKNAGLGQFEFKDAVKKDFLKKYGPKYTLENTFFKWESK